MKMPNKVFTLIVAFTLAFSVLTGCMGGGKPQDEEERTLRIATTQYAGENGQYIREQFLQIFEFNHPNITIEVIPTMDERYYVPYTGTNDEEETPKDPLVKLKELMEGPNPPDVVLVDYAQLAELINDNLLAPLDPLMTKDKFATDDLVPAVIDGIKALGNGTVYALAPQFTSQALVYNKKLFDDANIPYPTDDMTWDEIFDLARLVARGEGDDRIYGFNFYSSMGGDLLSGLNVYTQPLQMSMFDDNAENMTVDTEQWETTITKILELTNDNVMPPLDYSKRRFDNPDNSPFYYDDFMSGRLAMTLMHYSQLRQLFEANDNADNIQGYTRIDWDTVTMPSHPEQPGVGAYVELYGLMGINAKAANSQDAWELIKFINSPEYAKVKSRNSDLLVSYKSMIKPREGHDFNIAAFYNILPAPAADQYRHYREKPNLYYVQDVGRRELNKAVNGDITVKEALANWQEKGNKLLEQIKNNPSGPLEGIEELFGAEIGIIPRYAG